MSEVLVSKQESQQDAETINLLNLAIWQRVRQLATESPNGVVSFNHYKDCPDLGMFEAKSSDYFDELGSGESKINIEVEPIDDYWLRKSKNIAKGFIDDELKFVMYLSIGNERVIKDRNVRVIRTYSLFLQGILDKRITVFDESGEYDEVGNYCGDIGFLERQALLDELSSIDSIK